MLLDDHAHAGVDIVIPLIAVPDTLLRTTQHSSFPPSSLWPALITSSVEWRAAKWQRLCPWPNTPVIGWHFQDQFTVSERCRQIKNRKMKMMAKMSGWKVALSASPFEG